MASQLQGVAAATTALTEFGAKTSAREMRATVKAALEIAEHEARARMPIGIEPHKTYKGRLVSPGYALSTLHVEVKLNRRTGSVVASLGVGREAFYEVQFIELGTSKMPARPWLRPSFENSQDAMLQKIADELKARAEKVAAKAKKQQAGRNYGT